MYIKINFNVSSFLPWDIFVTMYALFYINSVLWESDIVVVKDSRSFRDEYKKYIICNISKVFASNIISICVYTVGIGIFL